MKLPSQEKSELRARAHHLEPVVSIGKNGLTKAVLDEIDQALTAHELIKVRIGLGDRFIRSEMVDGICDNLGAEFVSTIGGIVILHRKNEDKAD